MILGVIVIVAAIIFVAWFMSSSENEEAHKKLDKAAEERLDKVAHELFVFSSSMRGVLEELGEKGFLIDYNPVVYDGRVGYGVKWLAVYTLNKTGMGSGAAKSAGMEVMTAEKDGLVYYKYVVRSEVPKREKDTVYDLWAAKYAEQYPNDVIEKSDGTISVMPLKSALQRTIYDSVRKS